MKTFVIILFCSLGLLAMSKLAHGQHYGYYEKFQQQQQGLCDSWSCSQECYRVGLHGECNPYGECKCRQCIFDACKPYCRRVERKRYAQCDGEMCKCF